MPPEIESGDSVHSLLQSEIDGNAHSNRYSDAALAARLESGEADHAEGLGIETRRNAE
jgi:hypothetical protein